MSRSACLFLVMLIGLIGCGDTEVQHDPHALGQSAKPVGAIDQPARTNAVPADAPAEPKAAAAAPKKDSEKRLSRIHFKDGAGQRLHELKPKDDGAKLVDPQEKELARFNVSGRKVKVKRPDDSVVGYIVSKDGEFKLTDSTQKKELFELQRQSDGDWKLKSGNEQLQALIKVREYGLEIEDGHEKSLFKIKQRDGKIELRDARDMTVLSTNDSISLLGVACFGLSSIETLEMRAGLMVAIELSEHSGNRQ